MIVIKHSCSIFLFTNLSIHYDWSMVSGIRNEDVRQAYKLLHSVAGKFLEQRAYSHISISKIFGAMSIAEKAQVCKE